MLDVVTPAVGQRCSNPLTGQDETVAQYLANGFVVTDDHNLIILENTVGDMFYFPNETTIQYTVADRQGLCGDRRRLPDHRHQQFELEH